ncbi:ribokinase [Faecalicatena contorta]|uniref:Ribokinase n=1 Tax=Faecalicatena contorta TaxID=39482 RepID=A0A315ZUY0_9FIRM|nr:ribokinase [Faecalicatena contorta]PWJ48740.1 ribokinase [Faecalicatena contorta]SUQ15163.1 ribokinase [Faecalicatena contorta]
MKVLNFGSLNLDYVYSVDHMVAPGETLASFGMDIFCGGKGLNQSIALARAGVSVYHAGMVGEEGGELLKACEEGGVKTDYIRTIPGKSGHTIIQVDKEGQNCILLYGGANRRITEEYVDEVLAHFEKGDILLLQNEVNLLDYIIDQAYERGMMIILNPSPYDSALNACDFSKISMFLLNEIEGEQVTGEADTEMMLEKLKTIYPNARVVLTLGGNGAVYQYKDEQYKQRIYRVKVVDTTAAGDTFTGYFISSVIQGLPVQEGLSLAAKASAIAVSRQGATASIPLRKEVLDVEWNKQELC